MRALLKDQDSILGRFVVGTGDEPLKASLECSGTDYLVLPLWTVGSRGAGAGSRTITDGRAWLEKDLEYNGPGMGEIAAENLFSSIPIHAGCRSCARSAAPPSSSRKSNSRSRCRRASERRVVRVQGLARRISRPRLPRRRLLRCGAVDEARFHLIKSLGFALSLAFMFAVQSLADSGG